MIFPYVLMGVGGMAIVRGLFRPHRAVLKRGSVSRCAGPDEYGKCDSTVRLATQSGTPVYSTAPGRVIAAGANFVHIVASNEPVILMYRGVDPSVREDQSVGRGQPIGKAVGDKVSFGVWQVTAAGLQKIAPSAWLAARGFKHAAKDEGKGTRWCEGGREIHVPVSAQQACGLKLPERTGFALLPVELTIGDG